jgi:hypothetical protein
VIADADVIADAEMERNAPAVLNANAVAISKIKRLSRYYIGAVFL